MAKLRERDWITVEVAMAPLDKRFMVYIRGRGVPPPACPHACEGATAITSLLSN